MSKITASYTTELQLTSHLCLVCVRWMNTHRLASQVLLLDSHVTLPLPDQRTPPRPAQLMNRRRGLVYVYTTHIIHILPRGEGKSTVTLGNTLINWSVPSPAGELVTTIGWVWILSFRIKDWPISKLCCYFHSLLVGRRGQGNQSILWGTRKPFLPSRKNRTLVETNW